MRRKVMRGCRGGEGASDILVCGQRHFDQQIDQRKNVKTGLRFAAECCGCCWGCCCCIIFDITISLRQRQHLVAFFKIILVRTKTETGQLELVAVSAMEAMYATDQPTNQPPRQRRRQTNAGKTAPTRSPAQKKNAFADCTLRFGNNRNLNSKCRKSKKSKNPMDWNSETPRNSKFGNSEP